MTTDCFSCPPTNLKNHRLHDGVLAIAVAVIFVVPSLLAAYTLIVG